MQVHRRVAAAVAVCLISLEMPSISAAASADLAPNIPINPMREAYYGELHLHTIYSFDAYWYKNSRVDPDGAYRFARGEPSTYLEEEVRRSSPPLDFAAVTDHAEWMGVLNALENPNSTASRSGIGQQLRERKSTPPTGWPSVKAMPGLDTKEMTQSAWRRTIDAANRHYRPGQFTTFIGYEWTSMPGSRHLHRNVIFRGDSAPAPFTASDSIRPEDLWKHLASIRRQGYEALTIPHNANHSDGLMFDWVNSEGRPINQAYAELRASNEPLVEIAQNKGQSETHPALAPNDEFANFEVLNRTLSHLETKGKEAGSYVRDALGRGLMIAQRAGGANPYKYGFVGASDFHNGLSDSAETAYAGHLAAISPTIKLLDKLENTIKSQWGNGSLPRYHYELGSSGLTGVWAEQNTRESIYAALRRKETFATSGTRLKFRFFGSWEFEPSLLQSDDWIKTAYRLGMPMGGDLLPRTGGGNAPSFALWAVKDSNGANLDRLQIVKVWLESGKQVERIYDVALSNGRTVDPKTGRAPPVGNTVDLHKATYTNTIGAVELAAVWQDPQFNPKVPAVYYMRVLEIPTPRWSTLVAVKRGHSLPEGVPATLQERGWSSPIWFTPQISKLTNAQ